MSSFPYANLPPERYWRNAVARVPSTEIDPHAGSPVRFQFDKDSCIASAGSCFAQQLAQNLQDYGFHYLITEAGPPWFSAEQKAQYNYGVYPARFGNLYSPMQLWQLMQRSLGEFEPQESHWKDPQQEIFYDPFRPRIQAEGFASVEELQLNRAQHLKAVRQVWEQCEFFVLTFGMSEAWVNRQDGAVYPICPGRQYGKYDPDLYAFHNFSLRENESAMCQFLDTLKGLNPSVKVLLTVSPVPFVATMETQHVLPATVYSKSQLRVLAQELKNRYDWVDYFAAYEIITGTGNPSYYEANRRSISAQGMAHVLKVFYRHFYAGEAEHWVRVTRSENEKTAPPQPCDPEELAQYLEREADD